MNNKSYMKHCLVFAALALAPSVTAAQWNVARFDSTKAWAYGSFGLDPAFVATVGVAGMIPGRNRVQIGAELGSVVAAFDMHDWRARVAARTSVARWGAFRITGDGAFIARGTSNSIYSALNLGAASTWTAGFYRRRWFVAGEGGFDKAVATRITNSEWYRSYYYSDAKNGWYGPAGGIVHLGFTGGASIGNVELVARGGTLRTERLNQMIPPMYLSLGAGVGWR